MNIGFVSVWDPKDINCWSGTLFYMLKNLEKNNSITWIGKEVLEKAYRLHNFEYGRSKPFIPELYSDFIGYYITNCQNINQYDLLLVKDNFFISKAMISIPMVYIGDATFRQIKPIYTEFRKQYFWYLDNLEVMGLTKMDKIILSSEWAKNGMSRDYCIPKSQIEIIEFGANINIKPNKNEIKNRESIVIQCNLLFIGKSSKGKGLLKAYQAYKELKKNGLKCSLTILGCTDKFIDTSDPDLKIFIIDKSKKEDQKKFHKILTNSHIHILPTSFDCFGIVFCETCAYGIPSVTADVGGISQIIKNNYNGYLLSSKASPLNYASVIEKIVRDELLYKNLQENCIKEYKERLNWNIWNTKIQSSLQETLAIYKAKKDNNFYITTYLLGTNNQLENEFVDRKEFKTLFVDHDNYEAFIKIIEKAIIDDEDVIVICKPNHTFTKNYSKEIFIQQIISSAKNGVELLLGNTDKKANLWHMSQGIALPINFSSSNFFVIFRSVFNKLIYYKNKENTIENLLKMATENIITLYPMVSNQ